MSGPYELGDAVLLTGPFTLADGVTPVDPTTVTLSIQTPDGVVTEYTGGQLSHPSVGNFTYEIIPVDQAGPWIYKWSGSGNVYAASTDTYFQVNQSALIGANAC